MLWEKEAPYSEYSKDQPQPSLEAFPVPGSRGAMVVCPGGGYTHKAAHEGVPIARLLQGAGISAYVLDYRVSPCHREAPLSDARRAIRLLKQRGYEKVGILGFSAGGHLCCSAATLYEPGNPESADPVERFSSRPDVFCPCYAVVTFGKYTHMGSRESLLGEEKDNEALVRRFSAELNVTRDTPPAFIWHTAQDGLVPAQNSLQLAMALRDNDVMFELHVYPLGHHGIGLGSENQVASQWGGEMCRFLVGMGFGV
ncbi:MAG: alpha/beta hydrolase [Clostridia bacterium]|nr:alpha/beta hydrolase [Clostridia bacterium]